MPDVTSTRVVAIGRTGTMPVAIDAVSAAAWAGYDAGLCVIPPREDGSKATDGSWKAYQSKRPSIAQMRAWYPGRHGLGIITGAVSRNLECFEFDDAAAHEAFLELAGPAGLSDLVERITTGYSEATPNNGIHWLYFCEEIAGNTKLASRPKAEVEKEHPKDNVKTLIETRGEGGFVIIAPSHGPVHPSGKPYVALAGHPGAIATITPAERVELHRLARSLDQMPPKEQAVTKRPQEQTGRPGDDFNGRARWEDILEPAGWVRVFTSDGVTRWRRPGKREGVSATTNHGDSDLFYVFSSSTAFEPERGYSKFSAYAMLHHHDDFSAAAAELSRQGYGDGIPSRAIGSDEPWPPMRDLPDASEPVPNLPPELVPAPLRPWLVDMAERTSVPLEFVVVPALVAVATIVGRSIGIRPVRFDDWLVVPNLWGAIIAPPGWLKSTSIEQPLKPLRRLEAEARQVFEEASDAAEAQRAVFDAESADIKARITKAVKSGEPTDDLREQIKQKAQSAREQAVFQRRYLTSDATVEKLGELLKENPRGLLLVRDEIAGWIRIFDKAGREGEREFYLEAWNGTGAYTFDRIGRGTVHIPAMTLCVLGSIQPGKLAGVVRGALGAGDGADGLLQRLQLVVYPDHLGDWKPISRWPDREAKDRAYQVFTALDALGPGSICAETVEDEIPFLRFAPDAQVVFDQWRGELERRLRSGELGETPAFASHLAKYRSLMPSLALLFHLVDIAAGAEPGPVTEAAARLAAAWCEFLEEHARKIYAPEIAPGRDGARMLAEKIRRAEVSDGMTLREVSRKHWRGLDGPGAVEEALAVLEDAGWARVETIETGGRPSAAIRLHPELGGAG